MTRLLLLLLALLAAMLVGTAQCNPPPALIEQVVVNQPGFPGLARTDHPAEHCE